MVKVNYYYDKVGKDVEEWLAEIDYMIEANNIIAGRKVIVVAIYFKNIAANWYKANIMQYAD